MIWIFLWLCCSLITAGTFVAQMQRSFPRIAHAQYRFDLGVGCFMGLAFGPVGLIVSMFMSGFWEHGWTLLPPKE